MKIKGKKVFITGAGGFIGSHVVEAAIEAGARVTALIHYNSQNSYDNLELLDRKIIKQIKIITGDITDPFFMLRETKGFDFIFHLAALIPIPYSYIAPQAYIRTNIEGTLNILEATRINKISKLLVTSTSETYGTAKYAPIDENHPLQGQSPYAASKIGADKLAESYFLSFNLPVTIIRPFNTFGPRQSARAVIPTIISQILSGKDAIKLGSLSPVRDFNFVKDIARAFIESAECEINLGEVVNFGTGIGVTIGNLSRMIEKMIGGKIKIICDKQRIRPEKSEVFKLICDNRKAKKIVGWKPKYSLEKGLKETIDFIDKHPNLYKPDVYNL